MLHVSSVDHRFFDVFQILSNAHEMHRYFYEAKETLSMIQEKESSITDDLGRDQHGVSALQRHHKTFEADLQPLGVKVLMLIPLKMEC